MQLAAIVNDPHRMADKVVDAFIVSIIDENIVG